MSVSERVLYHPLTGRLGLAPLARWGLRRHEATGATPRPAYRAMRKLYGNVDRHLFDALVETAGAGHSLLDLPLEPTGVGAGQVASAVAGLESNGYVVLDGLVDASTCDALEEVARSATCRLVGGRPGGPDRAAWDEARPAAVRYDIDEQDLVQAPEAQRLIADESLLAIAQQYLGAAPVQDLVAMWWSAALADGPSEGAADAAAQAFHFDLDRLRFVKAFLLLTDVDDRTGPHVYVRGSHRAKTDQLRHDGRMRDAAVEAAYPGAIRRIGGPRGTVFLVDTVGLHKGQPLDAGHRLIFQVEYATSLFGAPFARPRVDVPGPELRERADRYPWTFQRFVLAGSP